MKRKCVGISLLLAGMFLAALGLSGQKALAYSSYETNPTEVSKSAGFDDFDDGFSSDGDEESHKKKRVMVEPKIPEQNDQTNNADGSIMIRLGPANVQTFLLPSAQSMSLAFVKLTGVDLTDPTMIDEFARVNYCAVFKKYYQDEFRWRYARKAIRQMIDRQFETYPEYFVIHGHSQLGRYNFDEHAFILPQESHMDNVGLFTLSFDWPSGCEPKETTHVVPVKYKVRLDNPVSLSRIPAASKFAEFIAREMDRRENFHRTTYVSFYIRVNDFSLSQDSIEVSGNVRATLLSMRVYADPGRTILIYDYRPQSVM